MSLNQFFFFFLRHLDNGHAKHGVLILNVDMMNPAENRR